MENKEIKKTERLIKRIEICLLELRKIGLDVVFNTPIELRNQLLEKQENK